MSNQNQAAETAVLDRLDEEIKFYGEHQAQYRFYHRLFTILEVIAAAMIPFILSLPTRDDWAWVTKTTAAFLGAAVVILQGVRGVFQFHETWLRHKTTWIALDGEKTLYQVNAEPYQSVDNPLALLAVRLQALVEGEVRRFTETQQRRSPNGDPADAGPKPRDATPDSSGANQAL